MSMSLLQITYPPTSLGELRKAEIFVVYSAHTFAVAPGARALWISLHCPEPGARDSKNAVHAGKSSIRIH
jgi:hypothetical protein